MESSSTSSVTPYVQLHIQALHVRKSGGQILKHIQHLCQKNMSGGGGGGGLATSFQFSHHCISQRTVRTSLAKPLDTRGPIASRGVRTYSNCDCPSRGGGGGGSVASPPRDRPMKPIWIFLFYIKS